MAAIEFRRANFNLETAVDADVSAPLKLELTFEVLDILPNAVEMKLSFLPPVDLGSSDDEEDVSEDCEGAGNNADEDDDDVENNKTEKSTANKSSKKQKAIDSKTLSIFVTNPDEQILDEIECGPFQQKGKRRVILEGQAPDYDKVPEASKLDNGGLLLTATYKEQEFYRCGWFLSHNFKDQKVQQEWQETGKRPLTVDFRKDLLRRVDFEHPIENRTIIEWAEEQPENGLRKNAGKINNASSGHNSSRSSEASGSSGGIHSGEQEERHATKRRRVQEGGGREKDRPSSGRSREGGGGKSKPKFIIE
ncbi:unnamed protein product [Amoebophrya sp. A120]|nr:unnamed protein product [Amoebophrya sp. A120]|eukprot:GSA120T00017255001.1